MQDRRHTIVAREGIPFLLFAAIACGLALHFLDLTYALSAAGLFVLLYLVFHDPSRDVPAVPLGVVSPVDGRVVAVEPTDKGVLQGEAQRILLRINALGTYTARSPVEGKIMDLRTVNGHRAIDQTNALWIQTDEGADVILQFRGYRIGLAPRAFLRIGERVGQGQRCAYLRLTRFAELHLPIAGKVLVAAGDRVVAGRDLIARLPHS